MILMSGMKNGIPLKMDGVIIISEENITLEENGKHGNAYENIDVKDDAYDDGKTANKSIEDLKKLKKEGNPFFLAVGFVKPHLPFNAPKKYWDLYEDCCKFNCQKILHLSENHAPTKRSESIIAG